MQSRALFLLSLLLYTASAKADVLVLKNGQVIIGNIGAESQTGYKVQQGATSQLYPTEKVSLMARKPTRKDDDSETGLPAWGEVVERVGTQRWGGSLQQVPATVIDQGVFRSVPYLSFRCGIDYEINIYGDPEHPSGVEIGCYNKLLTDPEAKENCIALIAGLVKRDDLMVAVKYANRNKDMLVAKEWLVEISPPEEPDSYGGWWVSIYDVKKLDTQRATAQELAMLTVPRSDISDAGTDSSGWSKQDLKLARPPTLAAPATRLLFVPTPTAPPPRTVVPTAPAYVQPTPTYVPRSSGGAVYVKGYTRRDGTYVQGYTRRR